MQKKLGAELSAVDALAAQLSSQLMANSNNNNNNDSNNNFRLLQKQQEQLQASGKSQSGRLPPVTCHEELESPPPPKAPKVSKMELYEGAEADDVFGEIDALAINVAKEDQQTFTDLVHHLTRHCLTDVQKVRAIFRWITVKNLNTMHFDSNVEPDTPLGLLRGIKNGSESYHVLFKRLCR